MLFDGHKIPSAVDLLRLDFFSRASRVRRFTFDVADPRIKDVLIPPAWKITHLRVNAAISCAINQVERAGGLPLQLLKRCRETLLEAHVVHAYSYRPFIVPAEDEGPLVDLPRLTILKVSKTAGHIMTRIDAPNLTYLVIDRARIDISLVTYLCRLTERHPSIRRLDLTALFWAETAMATIMPCLTALSTIQHLHVSNDNVDGFTIEIDKASRSIINIPFLTSLTCQRTGAPVLFPNLTSLSLKFAGIWPGPDPDAEYNKVVSEELVAAVRGLVRSRRVERLVDGLPVAALQSFTTDLPGLSHVDLQDI
ncbi:hypothetical protein BD626DRAFT_144825 [Schizophyllum amplum]|uniref:F-box domain-containing protein n=1 Tax=Schizophyllum amplum TaxID=97359 RepID=A0A550C4Y3_9AGAR|nr:hypothetical protein BD626DRAFT_144825 [Auriculariopsis ampla]